MAPPSNNLLQSLDSVPVETMNAHKDAKPVEVPVEFRKWLTNHVDQLNEILIDINTRLNNGGL